MIKKEYADVVVLPLADHPFDAQWSKNLDSLLNDSFPGSTFILWSRNSFIEYYNGSLKVIELPETGSHSATIIREQISDKVLGF